MLRKRSTANYDGARKNDLTSIKTDTLNFDADFSEYDVIDLSDLFMHLLEKWHIILLSMIVGAVLFAFVSLVIVKPEYEATSKLYILNNRDSAVNLSDLQLSSYLADDYQEVFKNWHVHELVLQRLGIDYTYEQLNKMVKIKNPSDTRILYITVSSNSPTEAQAMANTYADVAKEFIAVTMDTTEPSTFEEALLPDKPTSPKVLRNIIFGILSGLLIAVVILFIQYQMDDYVRTADDIVNNIHVPMLGSITDQNMQAHDGVSVKNSRRGKE